MRAAPLTDPEAEQARWEQEILPLLFGARYRAQHPDRMRSLARWRARHPTDPTGLRMQGQAWSTFDACERLRFITAPTLVLYGTDDGVATLEQARCMAERIPRARLVQMEGVGHSPNVEDPTLFNGEIRSFPTAAP